MFIITLTFTENRASAADHMAAHNDWLAQGFADGIFLASGSLRPAAGGVILAQGAPHEEIAARLAQDPFVVHNIVQATISEVALSRTDPRLDFLKAS